MRRLRRLGESDGFGLIELIAATTILSVAIAALLAGLVSGQNATRRVGSLSTATALAESQMQLYRSIPYSSIALTAGATVDTAYTSDPAMTDTTTIKTPNSACQATSSSGLCLTTTTCAAQAIACSPIQPSVAAADGHNYRVDSYVLLRTVAVPGLTGRPVKSVTVVIRDPVHPQTVYAREQSLFDQASG